MIVTQLTRDDAPQTTIKMNSKKESRASTMMLSIAFLIGAFVLSILGYKDQALSTIAVSAILQGLYGVMVHLEKED